MRGHKGLCKLLAFMMMAGLLMSSALAQESQADGTLRRIHVPILMYHYVSPLPPDADELRTDLTVEPEIFRSHLMYLRDQGYQTISLADLDAALNFGAPLPPRPVILTFDDGYIDHYLYVFPMLVEFGFSGTFFVITGRADEGNPRYLSWQQIQTMAASGMSIQGHTKNHIDLRNRTYEYLVYEIVGSLESIMAHTGLAPTMFAYPAGRYDDNTLRVMNSAPIARAVTTQSGTLHTTDNMLELPRLRVSGNLGVNGLARLLVLAPQ